MGLTKFNIIKSRDALGSNSLKEQTKEKQEHHDQKKHNVLKVIFEQSDYFWQDTGFSSQTELLGYFLDPKLVHLGDVDGFDFT